jgi:hypothetical protein
MSDDDDSSFIPGLFNTQLSDSISEVLMAGINAQKRHIDGKNLRYPVLPGELPKNFDTRHVEGFPEVEIPKWFFKDYKGNWITILSTPIDQAGCGSCWAFSTSLQFSDVIRFNLLKRYKDQACVSSIFFLPTFICTGESNVGTSKGIVNVDKIKMYGEEVKCQISAYFTVSFSPHIVQTDGKAIIDVKCQNTMAEWKTVITTNKTPEYLEKILGKDFLTCMGCQGNLIVCPLMLFTGAEEEAPGNVAGAPIIIDFPLSEWACLWGNEQLKQKFCSPEHLSGNIVYSFPPLYKADSYSYVTADYFSNESNRVTGINSMTDWIMASIYNYGPVTIGFSVYKSFMDFFKKPANAKSVYTAEQFITDYKNGFNTTALGGHAVVIVGWGQDPVPHWVVRNSWGTKWADAGYFRVERDIDVKMAQSGAVARMKFENEFGCLYFAPAPNPELYNEDSVNNDMKEYLLTVPLIKCPTFGGHPELTEQMTKNCGCRCAEYWDNATGACKHVDKIVYPPNREILAGAGIGTTTSSAYILIFIIALALALAVFLVIIHTTIYKMHHRRKHQVSEYRCVHPT